MEKNDCVTGISISLYELGICAVCLDMVESHFKQNIDLVKEY